ncbi:uncharacterized protein EDB91DRAFT_1170124 [Suillus paluster]|uniref:uncharacterized protein n=1 Tax=Suillus paluster TaxID=48578 RepID=UPI001B86E61D|nr:uncharacterized protein EDB91DRAFT_1170124 [Suillus paluster]KAG1724763.1 hypothetical protein EDB91DRAFT_1170124 [Suillus paluster]
MSLGQESQDDRDRPATAMSIHVFSFPPSFSKFQHAYGCLSQDFQQILSLYAVIKDQAVDIFIKFSHAADAYDLWNYWTVGILSVIAIILVLILVSRFLHTYFRPRLTKDSQRARTALQALQTVLVPSCSLWPARYIKLVQYASNHGSGSRIIIPLSMLLQDICDGVIELRDPASDLEDLVGDGVRAYGCYVHLSVEWKWWAEWLDRTLRGDLSDNTKSAYSSYLPASAQHLDRLIHLLARAPSPSTDHGPIINFDNYPLTHLATIQLPQGSQTTLEFTSLSSHISFLSMTHVLCTIPFLARRLPHRLSDILATINNTPHFKLSTLTNTSTAYADSLVTSSATLTYHPVARKQCVEELGIEGWRKKRMMLEFEAALVRRGWLERWNVVLEAR